MNRVQGVIFVCAVNEPRSVKELDHYIAVTIIEKNLSHIP